MSDLVKHSLTVMNRIAEFIQELNEEDLAQLANNQARLAIIPWGQDQPRVPAARAKPAPKAARKPAPIDPDQVIAAAEEMNDQGEAERYLAPMLVATLKAVAAKRNVALTGKDKKADIVDKLVFNLVGYRLESAVLRHR
jgi:hypothetical protein